MHIHRRFLITLLVTLVPVAFASTAQAASVGINPPSAPVVVAMAELKLTVTFDVASITPPGTVNLTFIVTNTGASVANQVAIDNLLPVEFEYVKGAPVELKNLGDLAPGDTITKSYAITVPSTVKTNRYVNEAIASASNADRIESIAAINVNNGQVLGAADTKVGTLAETGQSPVLLIIIGLLIVFAGARALAYTRPKVT